MNLTVRILGAELLHISTDRDHPQPTAKDTPTSEFGFSSHVNYTIDEAVRRWDPEAIRALSKMNRRAQ